MISVITTNIFSDTKYIELAILCLSRQTLKDFEWILIDGNYEINKNLVESLCKKYKIRYIHTPMCGATHIGRKYHWELYNNALMLCSNDLFIRFGIYRYIHPKTLEIAVEYNNKGIYLNLAQRTFEDNDILLKNEDEILDIYDIEIDKNHIENKMICQCGMFSFSKNKMISMNGNNEAAELNHHHEDVDLCARWKHMPGLQSVWLSNAMIRLDHNKDESKQIKDIKSTYLCCQPKCPGAAPDLFNLEEYDCFKFKYRDFIWAKCKQCNNISPINGDKYIQYLKTYKTYLAPIGVNKIVGRDLRILYNDIRKYSILSSKIELLQNSHTNMRYLQDTIK